LRRNERLIADREAIFLGPASEEPPIALSPSRRVASIALNLTTVVVQLRAIVVVLPESTGLEGGRAWRRDSVDAGDELLDRVVVIVDIHELAPVEIRAIGETN
jgi:hypothetical protein